MGLQFVVNHFALTVGGFKAFVVMDKPNQIAVVFRDVTPELTISEHEHNLWFNFLGQLNQRSWVSAATAMEFELGQVTQRTNVVVVLDLGIELNKANVLWFEHLHDLVCFSTELVKVLI